MSIHTFVNVNMVDIRLLFQIYLFGFAGREYSNGFIGNSKQSFLTIIGSLYSSYDRHAYSESSKPPES